MRDLHNYSLKDNNTFKIDVKCQRFIEFDTEEELIETLKTLEKKDEPILIIGSGSNFLFTKDFKGTILRSNIKAIKVEEKANDIFLQVSSGEKFDDIVEMAVLNGWYGMENLSLIPGDVGSSVIQNIGAYGKEVSQFIHKIEAIDLKSLKHQEIDPKDCDYCYRSSRFKNEWKNKFFITRVTYKLSKEFHPEIDYGNIRNKLYSQGISCPTARQLRNVVISIRKSKLPDPQILGNAGSFFINPIITKEKFKEISSLYKDIPFYNVDENHVKVPAAWMIEKCGWKGKSIGKAGVHSLQALVLVNLGGAQGKDILRLSESIQKDIKQKFGISIFPEVNII